MTERHTVPLTTAQTQALQATWRDPPGLIGWLSAVDHKAIGRRFIVTAFGFFVAAGLIALMMRTQLAGPQRGLIGPDLYNQLFTMHGTTMMFLFAVPVMQAFATYLVPLMVGARAIAFPRLNAYAYWVYVMGGLMLFVAFFLDTGPDAGWFSYPPLAGPEYSPGKRVDFWAQLVTFTELSALLEAVIIITTVFKLRAVGMTLSRMPLFVWGMLVTAFMVLFAMPSVMLASTALLLDRLVGTHFYNPAENGDPLLWQHLFWFFGHPEVYLIFVPGLGFMSTVIPTFARRPVVGYTAMVLALIATAFMAFGLWVHHMFATPFPAVGKLFFNVMSLAIAIPTAVQIFCWIATLATGRIVWKTPLLFVLAFFFILVLGGMTGLMLGSVPVDLQVHDTYFVVAHLHYVLLGGAVFPLFGAVHYWFPKITGRLPGERLGQLSFWLMFVGFNITFFPMHWLGLHGMPRRVYTYPAGLGWESMNLLATIGAYVLAGGVAVFIANLVASWRRHVPAGDDPWGSPTLEWATASPPPPYNFEAPPIVHALDPLWHPPREPRHIAGLALHQREVLVTTVLHAEPDHRYAMPSPTPWPFIGALATTTLFIGTVFTPWALVWGAAPVAVALTAWFWPKRHEHTREALALEQAP